MIVHVVEIHKSFLVGTGVNGGRVWIPDPAQLGMLRARAGLAAGQAPLPEVQVDTLAQAKYFFGIDH